MEIKSNYHWRDFIPRYKVPRHILDDDFAWVENRPKQFLKYKETYYHLNEFVENDVGTWPLIHPIMGIVLFLSHDGNQYLIGEAV